MRPSELHRALPEATPRVLDLQLKELLDDGLVVKRSEERRVGKECGS